jgi:hypothetical protein
VPFWGAFGLAPALDSEPRKRHRVGLTGRVITGRRISNGSARGKAVPQVFLLLS